MIITVYLALACALFEAFKDLAAKFALRQYNEWELSWALYIYSLPLLTIAALFEPRTTLHPYFLHIVAAAVVMNLAANYCYMRALRYSEMSLSLPLITFTPVFMLFTSPLFLGESPAPQALWGIICIVCGCYLLRIDATRRGLLAPFRALARSVGPRLMFAVALIWSVTANFDKLGILYSSPCLWLLANSLLTAVVLTPTVVWKARSDGRRLPSSRAIMWVGVCASAAWLFQMQALLRLDAPTVVAIKRTSVIFGVILGGLVLKEHGLRDRILAAVLMAAGVAIIAFSS